MGFAGSRGGERIPGGRELYRPSDLARVLRIKQLVFVEGLTLAGARRKLEEEKQASDELPFDEAPAPTKAAALNADARRRVTTVRNGLRTLLTMLSQPRPQRAMATASIPATVPDAAPAASARKTTTKRRKAAS